MHTNSERRSLYSQTFVGRDKELRQLQAAFDEAVDGQGAVIAVLGEPGIGKTALCQQLTSYAVGKRSRALEGRCHAAGSLSLPYLPFVEALRKLVLDLDVDELRAELGYGAAQIARIVPDVRARLSVVDQPPGDPEADRWRLLHAVTDFLRAASHATPLLLVLEDLHDADRGTIDLLLHVSRNLAGARLLVVGTYRDVEVVRTHPLSAALAELRRDSHFLRLPLRGLNEHEVQRMLASLSLNAIPQVFAELVHRQTEGNPLFVQELLRYVVELGIVESRDGILQRVENTRMVERIPEGLRDVIGQRFSRLSDEANQVLAIATVLGREFPLDALLRMCPLSEDDVISALEEAERVGLIREHTEKSGPIVYRFAHAFFRQTLYEEVSAPRRIRWHLQAASVLEELHAVRLDEHAAELAEHWSHSSAPTDLQKAISYCEIAAKHGMDVHAYGEGVRHLEKALDIQDVLNVPDSQKRCDLLLELGAALIFAGSGRRAADEVAPVAFRLATSLGDNHRAFRACIVAVEGLQTLGGWTIATLPSFAEWAERAHQSAEPDSSQSARADQLVAFATSVRGGRRDALTLWTRAINLAREHGDGRVMFEAAMGLLSGGAFPGNWPEEVRAAEAFSTCARDGVSPRLVGNLLMYASLTLLADGKRQRFDAIWRESADVHARGYPAGAYVIEPGKQAIACLIDGRLDETIELCQTGMRRGDEAGRPIMGRLLPLWAKLAAWRYMGQPDRSLEMVREFIALVGAAPDLLTQLTLAECVSLLGRMEEAKDIVSPLTDSGFDDWQIAELVLRLQLALLWRERDAAAELADRLQPVAHLVIVNGFTGSVARLIGLRWVVDGDVVRARAAFELAVRACEQIRFRPELAVARLDLAELILAHYPRERREALELVRLVTAESQSMSMQPSLKAALRLSQSMATKHGLTRRELQVAALIGSGCSNREIAEALVITEATAEVHVKHVLSKLGFRSRAQVSVWATEHGLDTLSKGY